MTVIKLNLRAPALLAVVLIAVTARAAFADPAGADPPPADQSWAIHGQATVVGQGHPAFPASYAGPNSLSSDADARETLDITLFAGFRLWKGAQLWINPEIDQGFGLNDTEGVAGFPNGEGAKVGKAAPYFRLQRVLLRQTIDLGGKAASVEPDINQLGGHQTDNRLVIWLGKFNVTDVFDANDYAHDSKHDFLNWGVIDAGTFDYAADAWGYTEGIAAEWYQGAWTLRAGFFDLSDVPNSERLDPGFGEFQIVAEVERRYALAGRAGSLKFTGFLSRGRMGSFADAIALGEETDSAPNVALVRRYRSRAGVSFDFQQAITADLGLFARGGLAGGDVEPYEFADIDRTISAGVSLKGERWKRPFDTVGLAVEVNGISKIHEQYLAAGGLGILIGDGQLPHPASEEILETYYDVTLDRFIQFGLDYQFVNNPAYNSDRGPVSIFAARLHAQF